MGQTWSLATEERFYILLLAASALSCNQEAPSVLAHRRLRHAMTFAEIVDWHGGDSDVPEH